MAAFGRWKLRPRVLVDVDRIDTSTTVLGTPVSAPIVVAPVAMQKLCHPDGETATARAAASGRDDHGALELGDDAARPCRGSRARRAALVPGVRVPRARHHAGADRRGVRARLRRARAHRRHAHPRTPRGRFARRLPHSRGPGSRCGHLRGAGLERRLARPRVARRPRAAGRAQGRPHGTRTRDERSSTARRRSSSPTTAVASSTVSARRSTRCRRSSRRSTAGPRSCSTAAFAAESTSSAPLRSAPAQCSSGERSPTVSPPTARPESARSSLFCGTRSSSACVCWVRVPGRGRAGARRVEAVILARHGESVFSERLLVNGEPRYPARSRRVGWRTPSSSGARSQTIPSMLCVTTEFERTRQTADVALAGRDVPRVVVPELNDPLYGDYEGGALEHYRAWADGPFRATSRPAEARPGGTSSSDTCAGFRLVLSWTEASALVVAHSLPIAYVLAALDGAAPARARAPREARASAPAEGGRARGSRRGSGGLVRLTNLVKLALAPGSPLGGSRARGLLGAPLAAARTAASRLRSPARRRLDVM